MLVYRVHWSARTRWDEGPVSALYPYSLKLLIIHVSNLAEGTIGYISQSTGGTELGGIVSWVENVYRLQWDAGKLNEWQ